MTGPHIITSERPACPLCTSQYVKHDGLHTSGEQLYRCKKCGHGFVYERVVPAGKGSGVIAGIVTIGRGMRWPGGIR